MKSLYIITSPLFFFLLTILASTDNKPHPIPFMLRQNNQTTDLNTAIDDMRRESYNGFVILLHFLNNSNLFSNQDITFLMPSDDDISLEDITQRNLQTFILRHTIPAWLMMNHMLRFPNKTLVPCSLQGRMFTVTKSGGSRVYVNNARIVSPNICQNSRISCHGISSVITFNQDSVMLSEEMVSSGSGNVTSLRH